MGRIKTDLRPTDAILLDELARAIGIASRTDANSILINKCCRHLIKWYSTDPHEQGCTGSSTHQPAVEPIYKVEPLEILPPLDF